MEKMTDSTVALAILRESLLDRAYQTGDKEAFYRLSAPDWEKAVVTERSKQEENILYDRQIDRRLELRQAGKTYQPNTNFEGKVTGHTPITETCPRCGSPMQIQNGRHMSFYGCTSYPKCRGTRPLPKGGEKS